VSSRFQANDLDAFLAKLVGERSSSRSRADHDDNAIVIQVMFCSHVSWTFPNKSRGSAGSAVRLVAWTWAVAERIWQPAVGSAAVSDPSK
jgi:hypothetical protein